MKITDYKISLNEITTIDDMTGLVGLEKTTRYITIEKVIDYIINRQNKIERSEEPTEIIWEIKFYLSDLTSHSYREVYTLMEALGDIGGQV